MKKKIFSAFLPLLLALVVILITLSGCGSTAAPAGWAGVTVAGENLYTVSGLGQLYSMTADSSNSLTNSWNVTVDNAPASSGGFGCSSPSTIVNVFGDLAVSGGKIYIAGYNGKVYAFDATTRLVSASKILDSDDPKPIVGGIIADGSRVFVGSSNGNLYALDGASLEQLWKFHTGEKIWSTPAIDNGTIFIGSFDKKVYALDAATGAKKWVFPTQGAIRATPVIDNGTVYIASFDRHIYAVDEATGALKWQYPAAGQSSARQWFWATPVVMDGFIYAPCLDGKVYAISTSDPTKVTVFDLGNKISSDPVVSSGQVVVATEDGKIFSIVASANKQILLLELKKINTKVPDLATLTPNDAIINTALAERDGVVFVHALKPDVVYAIDLSTKDFSVYTPSTLPLSASGGATIVTTTAPPLTTTVATTVTATLTTTVIVTK